MIKVVFAIEGQIQLSRMFQTASSTVQDWTPALSQSSYDLVATFSGPVFQSQGAEIDEVWPELSPEYALWKEAHYPGQPILQRTGLMKDSFVGHPGRNQLMIENTAPYFKYHQSIGPRTKLPRRAMMKLTENLIETVMKNFQTQWIEAMGG